MLGLPQGENRFVAGGFLTLRWAGVMPWTAMHPGKVYNSSHALRLFTGGGRKMKRLASAGGSFLNVSAFCRV